MVAGNTGPTVKCDIRRLDGWTALMAAAGSHEATVLPEGRNGELDVTKKSWRRTGRTNPLVRCTLGPCGRMYGGDNGNIAWVTLGSSSDPAPAPLLTSFAG